MFHAVVLACSVTMWQVSTIANNVRHDDIMDTMVITKNT